MVFQEQYVDSLLAKQGLLGHVRLNVNFGKTDVDALDML